MPSEADFPPDLRALETEYELIRELGQGGMAAVYLARRRDSGRLVAIKAIRARYLDDPDALQRFAREARTVAGLDHPNIVRTTAIEQIDDRAIAIIMEHVPGGTVRDRLREHGSFAAEHAESVLRDVASALQYAHRRGIVHRDVKPENIFLDASRGRALLSDFGIARSIEGDTGITLLGAALGTPQYMSPEQIDGQLVDGRSDIYSLGVLGWELLTGRRPWAGENLYGVIYKQKHEDLPRITALRPRVPANLLFAIEGALVKDRSRRWQTLDEFLEQLTYNPPPVLAQTFPAGALAAGDTPTLRFYRAALAEPESVTAGATAAVDAVDANDDRAARDLTQATPTADVALPVAATTPTTTSIDTPLVPVGIVGEPVHVAADDDAVRDTAAGAGLPFGSTDYALPSFAGGFDPDREVPSRPRRATRVLALVIPLAIAGTSLFIVLSGSASEQSRGRGSGGVTSSAGSIAQATEPSADSATPPRPVPAVSRVDGVVVDAAPPARRGPRTTSRPRAGVPTSTPATERTPTTLASERTADARAAPARGDSELVVPPPVDSVLEDPFRPPSAAPTDAGVAGPSSVAGTRAVPSPRCRLASTADQRACLLAYIAVNDAPLQRVYESLIAELRRLAHVSPGDPDPTTVQRLRVEQRAWLSVRDGECTGQRPADAGPFWAEPLSRCFSEMSAARTEELQEAVRRLRRKR